MVDLLEIAAREFYLGRINNGIKILKDGIGWESWRCEGAKQQYKLWLKTKTNRVKGDM